MYAIAPSAPCNLETEYESIFKKCTSPLLPPAPPSHLSSSRPLVKMSITWRKDGAAVNTGIRDFGRRLVISLPTVSDSGYYECEASLRGSSVASASAGAFLHVLGKPRLSDPAQLPLSERHNQPGKCTVCPCLHLCFAFWRRAL